MEQSFRMVPLSTLSGACYAFDTIPYCDSEIPDGTALVIRPMSEWAKLLFQESI